MRAYNEAVAEAYRMSDAGRRHAEAFTWTATAGHIREALTLAVERRRRRNG